MSDDRGRNVVVDEAEAPYLTKRLDGVRESVGVRVLCLVRWVKQECPPSPIPSG